MKGNSAVKRDHRAARRRPHQGNTSNTAFSASTRGIPFLNRFKIRREAHDSALPWQGEATTRRIDLEIKLQGS